MQQPKQTFDRDETGGRELITAIKSRDVATVRRLLDAAVDPNDAEGALGDSALYMAIELAEPEMARLLVEHGADPNHKPGRETPVSVAARTAQKDILELLLAKGGDPNRADSLGLTALHWAVHWSRKTSDQPTRPGYVDVVKVMLAGGADAAAASKDGRTPLHYAARLGEIEIAGLLIDAGADPAALDNDGDSAISIAADRGLADMVGELMARLPANALPPLIAAAISGDAGAVKAALAGDVAVDVKTADGFTALGWAARLGHADTIRTLIAAGADVSAKVRGESALAAACRLGHEATAIALIEAGPEAFAGGAGGRGDAAPLIAAAERGLTRVVGALVDAGAAIDGGVKKGKPTPLITALWHAQPGTALDLIRRGADVNANKGAALASASGYGYVDVVRELLARGADPNADKGFPLAEAIRTGHTDVVRLLLEAGVDASATVSSGDIREPPLAMAVRYGRDDVARVLIEAGAKLEAKADGLTALQWAIREGKTMIVRALLDAGAKPGGRGPLRAAVAAGDEAAVTQALEKGADATAFDERTRYSMLGWAASLGHAGVVEQLLAAGAPPDAESLIVAADHGHGAVVRRLLDAGAIGIDDATGTAALVDAARGGHVDVVTMLIGAGVAPDGRDPRGTTALIAAAQAGRTDVARALLDAGANPRERTPLGLTAATEAGMKKHFSLDAMLTDAERNWTGR